MSYKLSGISPLAYMGVEPSQPPQMLVEPRSPTVNDSRGFNLGTYWLVASPPPTTNWELWILVDLTGGLATWIQLFPGGAGGVIRLDADVGFAIPTLGVINVLGGENMNTFGDMSNNLFINLNHSIHLPNTNNTGTDGVLFLGAVGGVGGFTFLHNYGQFNTFLGETAGNLTLDVATSFANTGIGDNSLHSLTLGAQLNTALGSESLPALTTGDNNVALGSGSLQFLTTGSNNISVGSAAGSNYTGGESSNLIIGNAGILGESNTTRIGVDGAGVGQQDAAYMAGVYLRTIGAPNHVVSIDNLGKLGFVPGAGGGNGSLKITTFTSSGTWTKDPKSRRVTLYIWNGGAGGGSGAQGPTSAGFNNSWGGGGGGSCNTLIMSALSSFFNVTEPVIIGNGGNGGASQLGVNTPGNPGLIGGTSSVGNVSLAPSTAGGAQYVGNGGFINTTLISAGNGPKNTNNTYYFENNIPTGFNTSGQTKQGSGYFNAGFNGLTIGGSVISNQVGGNFTILPSWWTGAEGGGGGGADITTPWAGGDGGGVSSLNFGVSTLLIAGGAGGIETGTINGANGASGFPLADYPAGGLGGGGGGGQSSGLVAGNGGNGGVPGGGGGGGGGSLNGTPSGAGGNGGKGLVIIAEEIDATVTPSNSAAFMGILASNTGIVTGNGTPYLLGTTVAFTTLFDTSGGGFFPGDGLGTPASFSAPVTGIYYLEVQVMPFDNSLIKTVEIWPRIEIITPTRTYQNNVTVGPGGAIGGNVRNAIIAPVQCSTLFSTLVELTLGDVVTFQVNSNYGPLQMSLQGSANPLTFICGNLV